MIIASASCIGASPVLNHSNLKFSEMVLKTIFEVVEKIGEENFKLSYHWVG